MQKTESVYLSNDNGEIFCETNYSRVRDIARDLSFNDIYSIYIIFDSFDDLPIEAFYRGISTPINRPGIETLH